LTGALLKYIKAVKIHPGEIMLEPRVFLLMMFFSFSALHAQIPPLPSSGSSPTITAPAPTKTESEATDNTKSTEAKPTGSTVVEKYVDPEGNVQYKKYRYGYQYKGKTVTADKPQGEIQHKSVENSSGTESEEDYVWGFQYAKQNKTSSSSTPAKLKAQKFQNVKRAPVVLTAPGTDGAKTGADADKDKTKAATDASTAGKAEEIQKKLMDMMKQSNKQPPQ